jgi:hypothetical protein
VDLIEENLRKIGFDNAANISGQKRNWRWKIKMDDGSTIILELLADRSDQVGPRVQPLPTEAGGLDRKLTDTACDFGPLSFLFR